MVIYRLGSGRYPTNDGLGAILHGGRWNQKGTAVIYAAASRALCALEVLANANELAVNYIVTPIEVPEDLGKTALSVETLPSGWDAVQSITATGDIGTDWANGLMASVLVVPSAVIRREHNYILNPRHPDFLIICFLSPERFYFDDRLRRAWLRK